MGTLTLHELHPPRLLTASHLLDGFRSGKKDLDAWLEKHAVANQKSGASRTYVVTASCETVVAYYSLAPTALEIRLAVGAIRRNAPELVPMFLLGRLAVDTSWQGNGIASAMIKDARRRAQAASRIVGGKGLICHAVDERAKGFYVSQGFAPSPLAPLLLMYPLERFVMTVPMEDDRPLRSTPDQRASPTILMITPAVRCISGVARLLVGVTRHKVLWMSARANGVVTRRSGRS